MISPDWPKAQLGARVFSYSESAASCELRSFRRCNKDVPHTSPVVSMLVLMVACSSGPSGTSSPSPSRPAIPAGASVVAESCGSTPILKGGLPTWLDEAGAPDVPYVLTVPQRAAGFLFVQPLRSGHPENPANKILWVVDDQDASQLQITAHPAGMTQPTVSQSQPRASPGAIFPSIVDVPQPGCWHFDLSWSGRAVSVDLLYVSA